jgi:branched-chain amino acid aminotransferase
MKGGYIQYNGKFFRDEQLLFSGRDLFRLGIGLQEFFRAENNEILFTEDVYQHIIDAAESVNLRLPADFDTAGTRFCRDVARLLNKNKLYLAARVVVQLFPGADETDIILRAEEITRGFFPLNDTGLLLDLFTDATKSKNRIDNFEPGSRFLWMLAANSASYSGKQNMILLNNDGHPCEAIGCSFAFLKDEKIVFPAPESGGYQSTITKQIVKIAELCGYQSIEKADIDLEELLDADEMFLIDNCLGIQKVLGFRDRRYYSANTIAIALKFNELAENYRKGK